MDMCEAKRAWKAFFDAAIQKEKKGCSISGTTHRIQIQEAFQVSGFTVSDQRVLDLHGGFDGQTLVVKEGKRVLSVHRQGFIKLSPEVTKVARNIWQFNIRSQLLVNPALANVDLGNFSYIASLENTLSRGVCLARESIMDDEKKVVYDAVFMAQLFLE